MTEREAKIKEVVEAMLAIAMPLHTEALRVYLTKVTEDAVKKLEELEASGELAESGRTVERYLDRMIIKRKTRNATPYNLDDTFWVGFKTDLGE